MVGEGQIWPWREALSWPAVCVAAIFATLYGTACGRGFISDDYAWIRHGRFDDLSDVAHIFSSSVGFYRPLVSLSFGLNFHLFGLSPYGYGLTNLALALVCGIGVVALSREMRLPPRSAATAAALWLFNFHGINMSVLWLSGRTSLLLTMFSLTAAVAFLQRRTWIATAASMAAMLSKEEAALLPLVFSAWAYLERRQRPQWWWRVVPLWTALGVYLLLRASSEAMWPGNAPDFYEPTLRVTQVARNVAEYADRSMTFSLLTVLAAWVGVHRRFQLPRIDSHVLGFCGSWFLCGFAITAFLPVRSSLYAVFPSVAVALLAASCLEAMIGSERAARRLQIAWMGVCTLLLLLPVYSSRNLRWTALAELSSRVVDQLTNADPLLPDPTTVIIQDEEASMIRLTNAWAGLTPDMSFLTFQGRLDVRVDQARDLPTVNGNRITVQLTGGQLVGLPDR